MRQLQNRWGLFGLGALCLLLAHLVAQWGWSSRPAAATGDLLEANEDLGAVFVELEPGEFAGTLLLGGLRGLVADLLWIKADAASEAGQYYQSVALYQLITKVQPRFEQTWEYLAHDMAYNIFAAVPEEERWGWFMAGMEAMARGCERNPRSRRLVYRFAWFFHHKGEVVADQVLRSDFSGMVNPILQRYPSATEVVPVATVTERADQQLQVRTTVGEFALGDPVLLVAGTAVVGRGHIVARDGDAATVAITAGAADGTAVDGVVASLSNFELAARLFRAHIALAARLPDERAFTSARRLIPLTMERDGHRLRNSGRHLAALRRYLDALEEWQGVMPWVLDPANDMGPGAIEFSRESYDRNEGDLRRDSALLARALAPDAVTGRAMAEAIMQRDFATARNLLVLPGWRAVASDGGGVRWFDQTTAP